MHHMDALGKRKCLHKFSLKKTITRPRLFDQFMVVCEIDGI